MAKKKKEEIPFIKPVACITCKFENSCKTKHQFPNDLCEACDKYLEK